VQDGRSRRHVSQHWCGSEQLQSSPSRVPECIAGSSHACVFLSGERPRETVGQLLGPRHSPGFCAVDQLSARRARLHAIRVRNDRRLAPGGKLGGCESRAHTGLAGLARYCDGPVVHRQSCGGSERRRATKHDHHVQLEQYGLPGVCRRMRKNSPYMSRRVRRGFTLIELAIVVVIIGVLATLATYSVTQYIRYTKTGEAREIVASIM